MFTRAGPPGWLAGRLVWYLICGKGKLARARGGALKDAAEHLDNWLGPGGEPSLSWRMDYKWIPGVSMTLKQWVNDAIILGNDPMF